MPGTHVSRAAQATRGKSTASLRKTDTSISLNAKQRRHFYKPKHTILHYFSRNVSIEELAARHHMKVADVRQFARRYKELSIDKKFVDAQETCNALHLQQTTEQRACASNSTLPRTSSPPPPTPRLLETPLPATLAQDTHASEHITLLSLPTYDETAQTAEIPIIIYSQPKQHNTILPAPSQHKVLLLHIVKKHRKHHLRMRSQQKYTSTVISTLVLAPLIFSMLLPLITGCVAYGMYTQVRGLTLHGVNHLITIKNLFADVKSHPLNALDPAKLELVQQELQGAQNDFLALRRLVNRPDLYSTLVQIAPSASNLLTTVTNIVETALDATKMGLELSNVALIAAHVIHGSPLATNTTQPLLTASTIKVIENTIVHSNYYLQDMQQRMSQLQLQALPLSHDQQTLLKGLIAQLPALQTILGQAQQLASAGSWLLGIDHQRNFLVQTMDRGELRPGGGFTGQYGVLQITAGRMGSLNLRDVALLDYGGNGVEVGRLAPPEYRNWMNFGNWGLRDSNLSADYPTTARMNMQVFQDEGGGPVDGDISFTPTFIGHILAVTGPIYVSDYHETITALNLEERLHYYQQNYSAIALQSAKTSDHSHQARKAFTSLVGKLLLERVRHLSAAQLLALIKGAAQDIQARDLEIYFANPLAEQWLLAHQDGGAMNAFDTQDGFMVVQANISISKASTYVHTTEQDAVVLDAQGGATHHLTITLNYQQTGPVYGFDTYADYIRVYAPSKAQLISGAGFDSGQPLCDSSTCASIAPSLRTCPNSNTNLGDRYFQQPWPIHRLGAPTSVTSDLPGRAMFGGLTETPKNCISTISLSWYVPHAIRQTNGLPTYSLLIGKQGGYIPSIELTVDTQALANSALRPLQTNTDLTADTTFSLQTTKVQ